MGEDDLDEDPEFIGGFSPELLEVLLAYFDEHWIETVRWFDELMPREIPAAFRRRERVELTGMAPSAYPGLVTGMIR